jgi:hypothetical protein
MGKGPKGLFHQMIVFPEGFVKTKYPGYFWNAEEHQLYSIKPDGILKPLKQQKPRRWRVCGRHYEINDYHYQVSVHGKKKYLTLTNLLKIPRVANQVIDIQAA